MKQIPEYNDNELLATMMNSSEEEKRLNSICTEPMSVIYSKINS